jgi:hypothetical protein
MNPIASVRRAFRAGALGIFLAVVTTASLSMGDVHAAGNCGDANNCTADTFAEAIFSYANINAPNTQPNRHAFETWEDKEGGNWQNTAYCNPLNTTQTEPGSYPIPGNSAGVQAFVNGYGHTCWYWGIKATGDTLLAGSGSFRVYRDILHALRDPKIYDHDQCLNLAYAVLHSPWGTGDFSALC